MYDIIKIIIILYIMANKLAVWIDADVMKKLKIIAAQKDTTMSAIVEKLIAEFLERA